MEQILINKLQNILNLNENTVDSSIAKVLMQNLPQIKSLTIGEVAKMANCSKTSVVKFAKSFNLDGYKELIQRLTLEQNILDTQLSLVPDQTNFELLNNYYHLIQANLTYIKTNFTPEIIKVANLIRTKKRIFLFGKGANLNAMNLFHNYLLNLNYWSNFSTDLDVQKKLVKNVQADDLCFIFSYSGLTKEMLDIYQEVQSRGADIVLVTSNQLSPMYQLENINLLILQNEEFQENQRNSQLSILFITMEIIALLTNQ